MASKRLLFDTPGTSGVKNNKRLRTDIEIVDALNNSYDLGSDPNSDDEDDELLRAVNEEVGVGSDGENNDDMPLFAGRLENIEGEVEADMISDNASGMHDNESDVWGKILNANDLDDVQRPGFQIYDFETMSQPGFQWPDNIQKPKTELEWFQLFFTDGFFSQIVEETNKFADKKITNLAQLKRRSVWRNWAPVSICEMKACIGIIITMGLHSLKDMKDYWNKHDLKGVAGFRSIFSRDRFLQIYWLLHVCPALALDAGVAPKKSDKIQQVIDHVNNKSSQYFVPHQNISIDESMVAFRGRFSCIQFCPNKPTKYGIKLYTLVDSKTGYIYFVVPYFGASTTPYMPRPDLGPVNRAVLFMCQHLKENTRGEGYHIYTDRYYSSLFSIRSPSTKRV